MDNKNNSDKYSNNLWKNFSIFLGILLVVSIFTSGFRLNNDLDAVIYDLNQLNSKEGSQDVKNALDNAIRSLENAKLTTPTSNVIKGDTINNERVVVEEFSDFECPYCSRAYSTVKQMLEEYGDKIDFEYKHFPLNSIHPRAQKAAEAAECARDQGKFMEYHDLLFQNQKALNIDDLKNYASKVDLKEDVFNACLDSNQKASIVNNDLQEGISRGVTGTPTFFINGQRLVGAQPYENIKSVIDGELAKA